MAKIQWYGNSNMGDVLDLSINEKHTRAVYELDDGSKVIFYGDRLKSKEGELSSGTVEKVVYQDNNGDNLLVVSDARYKAGKLGDSMVESGPSGLYTLLAARNDNIIGSNIEDYLPGFRGDDRIMGAKAQTFSWEAEGTTYSPAARGRTTLSSLIPTAKAMIASPISKQRVRVRTTSVSIRKS